MVEHFMSLPADGQSRDIGHGEVFFIGTATTIIKLGGFTILTDPNFIHAGDHIHIGYGLTAQRLTNPAIEIEQLPHIDLCIVSHSHADHIDKVALSKLRKNLPIITTKQCMDMMKKHGFTEIRGLEHWEKVAIRKGMEWLRITSMPATHAPGVMKFMLPPVMGSMIEWGVGSAKAMFRLYITGDTLYTNTMQRIAESFSRINLALVHLGGTRVLGVLVTMDGEQGVKALKTVNPEEAIPVHYNDYNVFKSPLEEFKEAVAQAQLPTKVHYLDQGDRFVFDVPSLEQASGF